MPRYLRKLFEREGVTFSEYVLDQRLALAHRLLSDPRRAREKITSVAFAAGFGDVSYFYRVFRRRYDLLPRTCARRHGTCTDISPGVTRRASHAHLPAADAQLGEIELDAGSTAISLLRSPAFIRAAQFAVTSPRCRVRPTPS